jgi:hypothetical protein
MAKSPSGFRVGNVNYGRFSGVNPSRAANKNLTVKDQVKEIKSLDDEANKMLKEASRNYKLNSGKAAYGPKPPSMASKVAKGIAGGVVRGAMRATGVAGGVARGVGRFAGPIGALISMTTPTGDGWEDKPSGPLMSGNKSRGPGGGSLSAPARTEPSRSGGTSNSRGPSGPSGPNSGPSRSGGASNSAGPAGPSGPNSGPSRSSSPSKSSGPGGPSGPNSGPSTSTSAPATERFAKGSLVMAKSAKKNYYSKESVKRTKAYFGGSKKGKSC